METTFCDIFVAWIQNVLMKNDPNSCWIKTHEKHLYSTVKTKNTPELTVKYSFIMIIRSFIMCLTTCLIRGMFHPPKTNLKEETYTEKLNRGCSSRWTNIPLYWGNVVLHPMIDLTQSSSDVRRLSDFFWRASLLYPDYCGPYSNHNILQFTFVFK